MTVKKHKSTRASARTLASNAKPQKSKLPPDTDGLLKRAAARGKKVIAMYKSLNPDAEGHLLSNNFHDLMHLCDRA